MIFELTAAVGKLSVAVPATPVPGMIDRLGLLRDPVLIALAAAAVILVAISVWSVMHRR